MTVAPSSMALFQHYLQAIFSSFNPSFKKNKICPPDLSMSPKRVKEVEDMNDEVRRLKINERERRRMHDLNSAMDGLRSAMPYARG